MNPYMKAYMNRKHDTQMRFSGNPLSRKPGSTPEKREALRQRIAERKANGTLHKTPFVLEKASRPFQMNRGRWYVELTLTDGITRRVPAIPFENQEEAKAYTAEMTKHIGEEVSR